MKNDNRMERRAFGIELRGDGEDEKPTSLKGYAAVFNTISNGEMIAPGAFKRSLDHDTDIRAYWSHDQYGSKVLGRRKNGTLELNEDETGLYVEIKPNLNTTWGRDAIEAVARGDVDEMSFGFRPIQEEQTEIDGQQVRILKEVALGEVSPVSEAWYPTTHVEAREKDMDAEDPDPIPADHSTPKQPKQRALKLAILNLLEMEKTHGH